MSNFISRLPNKKPEDVTTEFLAYLINDFLPYRKAFLSLIDASLKSDSSEIATQYVINESHGRPDLILRDDKEQWIVICENKPWDEISVLHQDQLKCYENYLKSEECKDFQKKTLCLLASEKNKIRLLEDAQFVPDDNIEFVVITWQDIFNRFETVCPENTVTNFLIKELQSWMFPPVVAVPTEVLQNEKLIRERWSEIQTVVKQAKQFAEIDLSDYSFSAFCPNPKSDDKSLNYCGYYISDMKNHLTYYFGAHMAAQRFLVKVGKPSLFILMVRFEQYQNAFDNRKEGKPIIDTEILKKHGFEYDKPSRSKSWPCEYVYPLTGSSDGNIDSQELAHALAKILKEINEKM